ncbi:MAG: IclR family transcriptional regulator [Halobacteriota archaeon]
MKDSEKSTLAIKSVGRLFDIVEHMGENGVVTVTAVADDLDLAKSTAHSYLSSLVTRGYAIRQSDGYRLSLEFLSLGDRARRHHGLYMRAKPEIDELAASTGERVQLMVREGSSGVYIYQTQGTNAVQTDSHVGTTVALHATAVGKAYLAFLPEETVDAVLKASGLEAITDETITKLDELLADLATIRDRGYATNMEERITGMRAIGAPICDQTGTAIAAISLSAPTTRLQGEKLRTEIPEQVLQTARVIEIKTTYS